VGTLLDCSYSWCSPRSSPGFLLPALTASAADLSCSVSVAYVRIAARLRCCPSQMWTVFACPPAHHGTAGQHVSAPARRAQFDLQHKQSAPSLYCSLMAWLVRRSSGTLTPAIVRSVASPRSSVHSGACDGRNLPLSCIRCKTASCPNRVEVTAERHPCRNVGLRSATLDSEANETWPGPHSPVQPAGHGMRRCIVCLNAMLAAKTSQRRC